jgi:hypothetical protein
MPIDMSPNSVNADVAPYSVPPPQYGDPTQVARALSDMRLQQQQTQGVQIENQQKTLQMQSQAALQDAWRQAGGDPQKTMQIATQGGRVLPQDVMAFQQHSLQQQQGLLTLSADQRAAQAAKNDLIKPAIDSILQETDDTKLPGLWAQKEQALIDNGTLKPGEAIPFPGSRQGVQDYDTSLQAHSVAIKDAETQSTTAKNAADAGLATANAKKAAAETALQQAKIDHFKTLTATPEALAQRVAGSIDPTKYPDEYKRTLNEAQGAADLDGINAAIAKGAANVSEFEKSKALATDPQMQASAVDQAGKEAMARLPAERSLQASGAATQNAFEQQRTVRGEDYKAGQDYGETNSLVGTALQAVEQARAGGGVQGEAVKALTPAATLALANIKRLSGAMGEMGTGGMQDRALSTLTNAFQNRPVDKNALNETQQWLKTLGNAAADRKNAAAAALEQAYPGQKATRVARPYPEAMSYKMTATGAGGHKIGSNDGTTWFDATTGAKIQ